MLLLSRCVACRDDACDSPRMDSLLGPSSPSRRDFGYQTLNLSSRAPFPEPPSARDLYRASMQQPRRSTGTSPFWLDLDVASLPEATRGPCETFCQPQNWSSAFASPSDFTLKAYEAKPSSKGRYAYTLAIVSLAKPKDEPQKVRHAPTPPYSQPTYANHYNKYVVHPRLCDAFSAACHWSNAWVKTEKVQHVALVRKTEAEIKSFVHTMAFRLPGHNVAAMFKHKLSKTTSLEARAEAVVEVLSYILSISHLGVDRLVPLKEPVPQDMRVRLFLELAWGAGSGPTPTGSNSCDGRLESRDRLGLPTEWLMDMLKPSASASALPSKSVPPAMTLLPPLSCTLYVPPHEWRKRAKPGAFTVQVSNIHVTHAVQYTLTVLYHDAYDTPGAASVARRYSDFHALATHLEAKTALPVVALLPPKTLFASTDVRFVEHRSVRLQQFLNAVLGLSFTGMLDQTISMAAEPRVRAFLSLPAVQWNVVPHSHHALDRMDRFRAFSNSPTVSSSASPARKKLADVDKMLRDADRHDVDDDDDDEAHQLVALESSPYFMPRRAANPPAVRAGAA